MKSFWASKTVWFNVISGGLAFLDANQDVLPAALKPWVPVVIMAGNIFLRKITVEPVKLF